MLDNVEDLLTDVITSPRFDSEVFTLERILQVMLGPRAGTTLVGLLTVAPEVFDEVAEVRIPPEVHERLVAWRARFGLAIDNALNFLNNPDGIQGHNFATQIAHVEERRVLQGRLTLVRYNNEPQFFVADARGLPRPRRRRDGAPRAVPRAGRGRRRNRLAPARRRPADRTQDDRPQLTRASGRRLTDGGAVRHIYLAATGINRGKTTVCLGFLDGCLARGLRTGFMKPVGQRTVIEDGVPADEDAVLMRDVFRLPDPDARDEPGPHPARLHEGLHQGRGCRGPRGDDPCGACPARGRPRHRPDRGHGARRGWRRDRPVECGRGEMLGVPAIIVSEGGVGRPIDEIVLNAALFARHGVPVAGAIVNKVDLVAQPGLAGVLERGLARHGIPLLGVLPYRPILHESDARHGARGRPGRDDLAGAGPRSRHRQRGDRGHGAAAHAGARWAGDAA